MELVCALPEEVDYRMLSVLGMPSSFVSRALDVLDEYANYPSNIRGFDDFFRKNCSPKINKNIVFFRAGNFLTAFDIDSFRQSSKTVENY